MMNKTVLSHISVGESVIRSISTLILNSKLLQS